MMKKLSLIIFLLSLILFPLMAFANGVAPSITPVVPEPATLLLIASGLIGVFGLRRVLKK